MDSREIRTRLKAELGYNARQVSVRHDYYSMGSSIYFTVRDIAVDVAKVREFSKSCENVHYDEYVGEILSGGNTFVHVKLSDMVRETLIARTLPAVKAAVEKLENDTRGEKIGENFVVFLDTNRNLKVWDKVSDAWLPMHYSTPEGIALDLAIKGAAI